MKELVTIGFSGGLSSAFMTIKLIREYSHKYDFLCIFANTGKEHEETLKFVDRCDKAFNLSVVWLEAVFHKGRVGATHKIVDFKSAHRGKDIFESMCAKYGIPNAAYPHCNRELKINVIKSFKRAEGVVKNKYAIGYRVDEIDRMSVDAKKRNIIYPMISMFPTFNPEVRDFWDKQDFTLGIPSHLGNCVTCWKKSARKQLTIAKHAPEMFADFDYLERKYCNAGSGGERQFNSGARFNTDKISIREIVHRGQTESFHEFVDYKPEYQLDLLGYDSNDGCEESCEPI